MRISYTTLFTMLLFHVLSSDSQLCPFQFFQLFMKVIHLYYNQQRNQKIGYTFQFGLKKSRSVLLCNRDKTLNHITHQTSSSNVPFEFEKMVNKVGILQDLRQGKIFLFMFILFSLLKKTSMVIKMPFFQHNSKFSNLSLHQINLIISEYVHKNGDK